MLEVDPWTKPFKNLLNIEILLTGKVFFDILPDYSLGAMGAGVFYSSILTTADHLVVGNNVKRLSDINICDFILSGCIFFPSIRPQYAFRTRKIKHLADR